MNLKNYGNDRTTDEKLTEIVIYSRCFSYIYIDSDMLEKEVNIALKEFCKNFSLMPAPLLMEFLKLLLEGFVDVQEFIKVVNLLNTYLIRRGLCNLDPSSITRIFPTILKDVKKMCVDEYSNLVEITKFYLVNMSHGKAYYLPNDEKLTNSLLNENAYLLKTTRIVLDRIERFNNFAKVDLSQLNIEHIMPQKPNEYWKGVTDLSEEDYSNYANLIGNLTLCERHDNSRMGNNDFDYKKRY